MQYKQILSLLVYLGLSQAIIVPTDLEDGIHTVVTDDNGDPHFQLVSRHVEDKGSFHQRRDPLPSGKSGCTENGLDYSLLSEAQVALYDYCGASHDLKQGQDHPTVFNRDGVIAYICNLAPNHNTCADHEAKAAFASLSGTCGNPSSPVSGWYYIKEWHKTYGYDVLGADIC